MGVIWHKVWYDLWHNRLRTLLVILSITVGVFAVGATFGMVEQMLPTMDSAHQESLPSHATMYLDRPIGQDEIRALKKIPGIENAEGFNVVEIRWKLRPEDEWRRGNILQRDYEHQLYDLLTLKEGSWPEGRELGIERMHGPWYKIQPGSAVIIEVGEQERSLPVSAMIRHPFVPPPSMYDLAWFFGGPEVMEMFEIPNDRFVQVKFRVKSYSPGEARRLAGEVKDRLAKQGYFVQATLYQEPDRHWGRAFLDGMTMVIQVLAVLSMLLSIVLVLNTLTAIITQQTNQIGILKAIGGSSVTIANVYLVGVLAYGVISILIAWPLGAFVSFNISKWFLALYNIDYENYSLSNRVLIIQACAAIAVPLLAAMIPVMKGAAMSVRQAISSYGLGGDFGSTWIDRAVERIGRRFLASHQAIALANTFRRKGRLVLTQLVLIISGVMFLIVMSLSSSINYTMDAEFTRRSHSIIITFEDLQRIDRTAEMAQGVQGVEKADMWLVAPATILHQGARSLDAGMGSQLEGVPLDDPMYAPMIVDGRWLRPGDERVIVMNKDTADDENIHVGDPVTLDLGDWGVHNWKVVGLYRTFLMFGGGFNVDTIFAPRQEVFEVTKKTGKGSSLIVRTYNTGEQGVQEVSDRLNAVLRANHIGVRATETMTQTRKTMDASFSYVIIMLLVLAIVVALVGGIGLMGSLWISVIERRKEIGIMRAIGARSWDIVSMFVLESVLQGLMSWVIAVLISMAAAPQLSKMLGVTMFQSQLLYRYNVQAVFTWLGIILVLSVLASAIPARNAAQVNVSQSLSYE